MERFIKCEVIVVRQMPDQPRDVRVGIQALIDAYAVEAMFEHGPTECEVCLTSGSRRLIAEPLAAFGERVVAARQ